MEKRTAIALSAFIIASAFLRIYLPWHHVFQDNWVRFWEADPYYHLYIVDYLKAHGFCWQFEGFIIYPNSIMIQVTPFEALLYLIGNEKFMAFLPALLGILVIIPVYFIGKTLAGRICGLVSAAIVAVLPGEILWRTYLGFVDHHALEILLSTCYVLFILKGLKQTKWFLAAGLAMALYVWIWHGGIVFIGITAIAAFAYGIYNIHNGKGKALLASSSITLIVSLPFFFQMLPRETVITIQEMRPATGIDMFYNFGLAFLIALAGVTGLFYKLDKTKTPETIFLLVWSIALFCAVLYEMRFCYYFAINVAVLSGLVFEWLRKAIANKPRLQKALLSLLLTLILLPLPFLAVFLASQDNPAPSSDWHEALIWLKENSPDTADYAVTSWGDYGSWILAIANRYVSNTPGPGNQRISRLFLTDNATERTEMADILKTRYVIIDDTLIGKSWAMKVYAGDGYDLRFGSFLVLDYYDEPVPNFTVIHRNNTIKIYQYNP